MCGGRGKECKKFAGLVYMELPFNGDLDLLKFEL